MPEIGRRFWSKPQFRRVPQVSLVLRDLGVAASAVSVVRIALSLSSFWGLRASAVSLPPSLATAARPRAPHLVPNLHPIWLLVPEELIFPMFVHHISGRLASLSLGSCLRHCTASMARGTCILSHLVVIAANHSSVTRRTAIGCSRFSIGCDADIVLWFWDM